MFPPGPPRHLNRVQHGFCFHVCCDPPTDDGSGVGVDDEAHVCNTCPGRHERQVVTQSWFGAVDENTRFTKSGCRVALGSGLVVFTLLERFTPSIQRERMSRAV